MAEADSPPERWRRRGKLRPGDWRLLWRLGWSAVWVLLPMLIVVAVFVRWQVAAVLGLLGVGSAFVIFVPGLVRLRRRDPGRVEYLGPVEPVIVTDDSNYAEVWLRMSDALHYMEAIDVSKNEYRMYLSTGEVCELWVAAGDRVQATPTGRFDRSSAVALMRRAGHLEDGDEDLEAAVWRTARERP